MAPATRLVVENVAVPDESATPPGVRSVLVVVSKKSTVPVGVPEPGALAVTVAVKVTVWPDVRRRRRSAGDGRRAVLVDDLADGGRDGAGVEVAIAARVGRGDRVRGRAEAARGQRRLVVAADDTDVPVPIDLPPS